MRNRKVINEVDANLISRVAVNHDSDGILDEKICIENHEIDDQQLLNLKVEYEDHILSITRHKRKTVRKRKETLIKKIIPHSLGKKSSRLNCDNWKTERQTQLDGEEVPRERRRPFISRLAKNQSISSLDEEICLEEQEINDKQVVNSEVDSEDDTPLSIRLYKRKTKRKNRNEKIIPQIPKDKLKDFKSSLKCAKQKNERQKQLQFLDEEICTEEQEIIDKQVVNSEVDSENDIPLSIRLHQRKTKRKNRNKKIIPQIPKDKLKDFKSSLKCAKQKNERQKQLQECIERMRSHSSQHWNSPCTILKAINHALCNRKWNNVTSLLLMLIPHGGNKYTHYIHHICEIMEKANPLLKSSGLQWQFETVRKLYMLQTKDV